MSLFKEKQKVFPPVDLQGVHSSGTQEDTRRKANVEQAGNRADRGQKRRQFFMAPRVVQR